MIYLKKSDTLWYIIKFMSSKDYEEEHVNHPKSDNIGWYFMVNHKENEVTKELFQLNFSRYQTRLETSMKGSNFNCVFLLY